jgi:NTE family protein
MGSADFPSGIGLRVHRNFRGEARGEIKAGEGFTIGLHAVRPVRLTRKCARAAPAAPHPAATSRRGTCGCYVDGALIRTMHASLALEQKCNFVICINPIVSFDASRARRPINLVDEGLPAILGQTFRALVYSRMKVGMATYAARFPAADTLLLEPDRHDERLFFANVFRYAERLSLADHAYRRTRRDLLAQADVIAPLLERRGLRLNLKVLRDPNRSLPAASKSSQRVRQTARRLDLALERIERMLRAPGFPG